jgi:predicted nucleotidyltransferase
MAQKEDLLKQIKYCLMDVYHQRLRGIVLYGSEARGQAGANSDLDILVLLDGPVDYGRDLDTNLKALYPLSLQIGRRISAKPVAPSEYESLDCPLYRNAHREGIMI